jgi:hypothetical protein
METSKLQPTTTQTFQVGNTAINVQDSDFQYGYQRGYARFHERYAYTKLTDWDVSKFIILNIVDGFVSSERANAGYVTGWIAALLEHRQTVSEQGSTTT